MVLGIAKRLSKTIANKLGSPPSGLFAMNQILDRSVLKPQIIDKRKKKSIDSVPKILINQKLLTKCANFTNSYPWTFSKTSKQYNRTRNGWLFRTDPLTGCGNLGSKTEYSPITQ